MFARTYEGVGHLTVEYGTPGSAPTSCGADPENPDDPENPSNGDPIIL